MVTHNHGRILGSREKKIIFLLEDFLTVISLRYISCDLTVISHVHLTVISLRFIVTFPRYLSGEKNLIDKTRDAKGPPAKKGRESPKVHSLRHTASFKKKIFALGDMP